MTKIIIALFSIITFSLNSQALTLHQVYNSAKANTAAIKDKQYSVEIAQEQKKQAVATVLPQLSAQHSSVWQEEVAGSVFGNDHQSTSYLSLAQNLFQGGGEYAALRVAKLLPKIAQLQKEQQEITLFYNVSQKFFALKRLRKEVQTLNEQSKALESRVQNLRQRVKIGRNKKTDLLAARSQMARLVASLAQVKSSETQLEQDLMNLTGLLNLESLESPTTADTQLPVDGLNQLVQSPQVKIMELSLNKAKEQVSVSKGNYLPSVDVEGRYYLERTGVTNQSDWDVSLTASWNLFNGGKDRSEHKIANLESLRLKAQLNDLKRNLTNEYKAQLAKLKRQEESLERLDQAVKLSKQNYNEHLREANRGLVSQLQVIQAFEDYLNVQRSYDQELYSPELTRIYLRSLAGIKP